MTREEIKNTPEVVDHLLDKSVLVDTKEKLQKRLDEICNLAIKALEPKTGQWKDGDDGSIVCSICGCEMWESDLIDGKANYCPNCGVKMRE